MLVNTTIKTYGLKQNTSQVVKKYLENILVKMLRQIRCKWINSNTT